MNARTPFGRTLAVALVLMLSQLGVAFAGVATPHLVEPQQVADRLVDGARSRADSVRRLQDALATPEVQRQARAMGVSVTRLRAAVPHLSDAELAELNRRAAQAQDVAAGYHGNDGMLILGLLLLLAGLAVLVAVADYDDDYYYDDCYCY